MTRAAAIIGATGGIGMELVAALRSEDEYDIVLPFARGLSGEQRIDLANEDSIAKAAQWVADQPVSLELVIVATGLLHRGDAGPEKTMRDLDHDWMVENYTVNAVGPALVAKHFMPVMARDERAIFAALSARVGSISDNRLGGWYGYRASKAALNQLIRTLAIEWGRTHKRSIAVALHPGTVDTALSAPFQGNVAPENLFASDRAALQLLDVLDGLKPADTGQIFAWDGAEIKP